MGKRQGNKKYTCWIEDKQTEKQGAVIWRKSPEGAASEYAADRWLLDHDLGPHVVIVRAAGGFLHRFRIEMRLIENATFKSGKKGFYLETAALEIDAYGNTIRPPPA